MTFAKAAASVAAVLISTSALSQTVLNTQLAAINGNYGSGVATTTTNANGTTTTVVGPAGGANRATGAPNGSWYQSDVGGGGTVGITTTYSNDGNGAAFFNTTSDASKGDLRYNFTAPVALSSLTAASFDFYRDATTTSGANFAPVLRFDMLKNGSFAGSLVFEYIYQGQTPPPIGTWTTMNATLNSGIFWATNAALGPTFASADGGQKTLAAWLSANAGSDLAVIGLSTGVGSGWNGTFSGAVDHVAVAFDGRASQNFDFAVAAGVPEPASWALLITGFGLVGAAARRRRNIVTA